MISVQTGSANSLNSASQTAKMQKSADVSKVSADTSGNQETAAKAPDVDTVEISDEGKSKLAAAVKETTSVQSSTSGVNTSQNLSSYTDNQLKKMVNDGEISRAQYNTEVNRREQASAADSTDSAQENDESAIVIE